jgi:serine/threonine protein kinase
MGERRMGEQANFIRECSILSRTIHPNILPFYGVVVDQQKRPLYMAAELAPGGSLAELQHRHPRFRAACGGLVAADAVLVLHDVFMGLEYLHSRAQPVIHRDVKPANVLIFLTNGAANASIASMLPWVELATRLALTF